MEAHIRSLAVISILLLGLPAGGPVRCAESSGSDVDSILATVNTATITRSRIERRLEMLHSNPQAAGISFEQALAIEINRRLLIQAAEREFGQKAVERLRARAAERAAVRIDPRKPVLGADGSAADNLYEDTLIRLYLDKKVEGNIHVTPAEIRQYHEANSGAHSPGESVEIRQILVRVGERNAEEAKTLIEAAAARIGDGEDFAKVAADVSEGPYRASGGLWPPQPRGVLVREVEEVAFSLAPGGTSPPFQSPLGWHIIKLEKRVEPSPPSFEEVQQEIERKLTMQRRLAAEADLLEKLRSQAVVVILSP